MTPGKATTHLVLAETWRPWVHDAAADAPPEIVRVGISFCRQEFDDPVKVGECITTFAESTSPDELRRQLACIAGADTTRDAEACERAVAKLPYRDGTTALETLLGSDAAEYAREIVAAAEPILLRWERPELVPVVSPPAPALVPAVAAARRGRGRPPAVPLEQQMSACMPQLPAELRTRLDALLPGLLEDIEDRLFTSAIAQKREFCHQLRDAARVEPRLTPLEGCLCGTD